MLRTKAALLLFAAVVGTCGPLTAQGQLATQADANDYFAPRSDYLQQRLQSNEKNHLYKGMKHLSDGSSMGATPSGQTELLRAKSEFDFILNYWPNHPYVLALMAEALTKAGRPQMIEQYFVRAYAYSSKEEAPVFVAHGISLLRQGDTKRAIEKLTRAVELDPDSRDGHYNLGLAYVRAKDFARANEEAQKAYALGHPLPGLRVQLEKAGAWKPAATTGSAPGETSRSATATNRKAD